jgi:hypothetical protein
LTIKMRDRLLPHQIMVMNNGPILGGQVHKRNQWGHRQGQFGRSATQMKYPPTSEELLKVATIIFSHTSSI